ncbi:SDR family NAD(P)-dependent oxidoreductase [Bernardetia sp. Wsw4-3y2]|uniref:SDR family NAD(P)-dependent oxidoreductase n=1 Tax=Bernardetia sp. Wsw4-3y2 TaxID=3127471 RepID=UPI0030CD3BDD
MKTLYFITGTSSGIGNALTNHILSTEKDVLVEGISRTQTIHHGNYKHHTFDLSKIDELIGFFGKLDLEKRIKSKIDKVVLINNAGTLGQVGHVGKIPSQDIVKTMNINTIAPFVLMNEFLHTFDTNTFGNIEKVIINISSGAGKRPIDGWSVYCASKAGLNLFAEVVKEEEKILNQNTQIFNISVGVVDTNMQGEIRKTTQNEFSSVEYFKELKDNNQLASPEFVAEKIYSIIEKPQNFEDIWQKLQ